MDIKYVSLLWILMRLSTIPFFSCLLVGAAHLACRQPVSEPSINDDFVSLADKNVPPLQAEMKLREGKIKVGLSTKSKNEWAGKYTCGDFFTHCDLIWSPLEGFVFVFAGCEGSDYLSEGIVEESETSIIFKSQGSVPTSTIRLPEKLIKVKWGRHHYLLEENELLDFCNDVNAFGKVVSNLGWPPYYFKEADRDRLTKGLPLVPEAFQPYLLAHPVNASVIQINKGNRSILRLDAGESQGLRAGMKLHRRGQGNCTYVFHIQKVGESWCDGALEVSGHRDCPGAELGWKFSTRSPY